MDFVKLLRSAEELVFLVASWIILIPKTVGRVLASAEWTYTYVQAQCAIEKPEDRYNDYFPPVLFWLAGGILPYITVLNHYVKPSPEGSPTGFQNLPLEQQLGITTLFFIGLPIGFSFVFNFFQRNRLHRNSLQPMFLTQCYCMALFTLSFVPGLIVVLGPKKLPFSARHWVMIAVIGSIWLLQTEFRVLRTALRTSFLKTLLWTMIHVVLTLIFTILMAVVTALLISIVYIDVP